MNRSLLNSNQRSALTTAGLFNEQEYRDVQKANLGPYTPLRSLSGLALELGIRDVLVKDESERLNLNSFKVLGVSYALQKLLSERKLTRNSVLVCATEGNHGRAVAHVANKHGLEAKIYIPADAPAVRVKAIAQEGADLILVAGNYDDAVQLATEAAANNGWEIISDTSWAGYDYVPRLIMAGYTRMLAEAESQCSPQPLPEVVLVQAGVGGLAAAAVSWLCHRYGPRRPFTIICEPTTAACLLESTLAKKPVSLPGPFPTIMAGLRCGNVSRIAWPVTAATADAFVAIDDQWSIKAMRVLAHPSNSDPKVAAGASGACGLAALLAILQDETLRELRIASGLNQEARVLLLNTEGATDPELDERTTGRINAQISRIRLDEFGQSKVTW